jgi:hypothetical protein
MSASIQSLCTAIIGHCLCLGSPADKADLEVGDEILEVNGKSLEDATHTEVISHIHQVGDRPRAPHAASWPALEIDITEFLCVLRTVHTQCIHWHIALSVHPQVSSPKLPDACNCGACHIYNPPIKWNANLSFF